MKQIEEIENEVKYEMFMINLPDSVQAAHSFSLHKSDHSKSKSSYDAIFLVSGNKRLHQISSSKSLIFKMSPNRTKTRFYNINNQKNIQNLSNFGLQTPNYCSESNGIFFCIRKLQNNGKSVDKGRNGTTSKTINT